MGEEDRETSSEQEKLEELLLEGLHSGPAVEMTPEDWANIRHEVAKRLEERLEVQVGQGVLRVLHNKRDGIDKLIEE